MEFTVGFAGLTADGRPTRCEATLDTDLAGEPASLQGAYATALKDGITNPDYFVVDGAMYRPGRDFKPGAYNDREIVHVFPWRPESGRHGIERLYKPDVALISLSGDYGYELSDTQVLELAKVLEQATSFSRFFDLLPIGFAYRYYCPDRGNYKVLAQSDNGYTMWSAESRSDSALGGGDWRMGGAK
jgi:hypothetical protein